MGGAVLVYEKKLENVGVTSMVAGGANGNTFRTIFGLMRMVALL